MISFAERSDSAIAPRPSANPVDERCAVGAVLEEDQHSGVEDPPAREEATGQAIQERQATPSTTEAIDASTSTPEPFLDPNTGHVDPRPVIDDRFFT
jgi:hypothetical protein